MISVILGHVFALHLVIDPGHGGLDTGASYYGVNESTITMNIANDLKKLLKQDSNIKTTLTRYQNNKISLKQRATKAHKKGAHLFVSIHTNSSPDKKAKGAEVYFENQLGVEDETLFLAHREQQLEIGKAISGRPSLFKDKYPNEISAILDDLAKTKFHQHSYLFAKKVKQEWQSQTNKPLRLRQAPFYVISHTNMPSVLVEVGFLSNPKEAKLLKSRSYQKKIAQILYNAIKEWKEQWTFHRSQL